MSRARSASASRARCIARSALLAGGISAFDTGAVAAADVAYGEYLAAECATCHRAEGTNAAIPPFHVVGYENLVAALKAYRDGRRTNATMQSVARSLGDAEIEALAAYLSSHS